MKRLCLFLLLVSLASCGPPLVWDKPGLDLKAKSDDRTDCERLAWRQAVDAEHAMMFRYPMVVTRQGRLQVPHSHFDRYGWEDRFYSTCMQAKGYRLVPLQQAQDVQGG